MKIKDRMYVMVKDVARCVYSSLPSTVKHSKKYNSVYRDTKQLLVASESWSKEQLFDYQDRKIRELVTYAYNNVPYYKNLFKECNLHPSDIKGAVDLIKIPYLTKDIIKRENKNLLSVNFQSKDVVEHLTGGSTGKPTKFYFEKDYDQAREDAYVDYIYEKFGYSSSERTIVFGDTTFIREAESMNEKTICKKYPGVNRWHFSYARIEKEAKKYFEELRKVNPLWIIACPSHIYRLVMAFNVNGLKNTGINVKGIIFKSEMLYPFQKEVIDDFFHTRYYQVYGHTEHLCMASTCSVSEEYHMIETYGVSQFEKFDDSRYELIATGLDNYAMPIIRYKTQDLFTLDDGECKCGNNGRLIKTIDGRTSDVLYLKDGRIVTDIFCDFSTLPGEWKNEVEQYQIVQKIKGECDLLIVLRENVILSQAQLDQIKTSCEEYFFSQMLVNVEVVRNIKRTSRGKEKLIVSLVK